MKIRTGFVSNSSSSSFTCYVCGNTESGWELELYEAGMYICEEGHEFCDKHLVQTEEFEDEDVDRYEVPKENCPICCMVDMSDYDIKKYTLKMENMTSTEFAAKMYKRFGSYDNFLAWLKEETE